MGLPLWAQTHIWFAILIIIACEGFLTVVLFVRRVWSVLEPRFINTIADHIALLIADLTGSFRKNYLKNVVSQHQYLDMKGYTIQGPFALELDQVFVDVGITPRSIHATSADMLEQVPPHLREGRHTIWEYLLDVQDRAPALVVLGAPGAGKPTLLKHISLMFAHKRSPHPKLLPRNNIPIHLFLREHAKTICENPDIRLVDLLHKHLKNGELVIPGRWFARLLKSGRVLLMFDGLDEVADYDQRQTVVKWVQRQITRHGRNRVIITSRPHGYTDNPLLGVTVLSVLPLTQSQVAEFIKKLYIATEATGQAASRFLRGEREPLRHIDRGVRIKAKAGATALIEALRKAPAIGELAINPLLLTLIATVHKWHSKLPGRQVDLYAHILELTLERRQDAKELPSRLTPSQKQLVLKPLAWHMMDRRSLSIMEADAASVIAAPLRTT